MREEDLKDRLRNIQFSPIPTPPIHTGVTRAVYDPYPSTTVHPTPTGTGVERSHFKHVEDGPGQPHTDRSPHPALWGPGGRVRVGKELPRVRWT